MRLEHTDLLLELERHIDPENDEMANHYNRGIVRCCEVIRKLAEWEGLMMAKYYEEEK